MKFLRNTYLSLDLPSGPQAFTKRSPEGHVVNGTLWIDRIHQPTSSLYYLITNRRSMIVSALMAVSSKKKIPEAPSEWTEIHRPAS